MLFSLSLIRLSIKQAKSCLSRQSSMDPKGQSLLHVLSLCASWGVCLGFWVLILQSFLLLSLSLSPHHGTAHRKALVPSLSRFSDAAFGTGLTVQGSAVLSAGIRTDSTPDGTLKDSGRTDTVQGYQAGREGMPLGEVGGSGNSTVEWKVTAWKEDKEDPALRIVPGVNADREVCDGRRIFMYDLPRRFHQEMIDNCDSPCDGCDSLCPSLERDGLGASLLPEDDSEAYDQQIVDEYEEQVTSSGLTSLLATSTKRRYEFGPWLGSQQNMIGVMFRARLLKYECLTTDWEKADAVYVPALFGLKSMYGVHLPYQEIESLGDDLGEFLAAQPAFKRHDGADHFLVIGQQIWDYFLRTRQHPNLTEVWGSYLFFRSVLIKAAFVSVERLVWEERSHSVPYGTGFHPSSKTEVEEWVAHVKGHPRPTLATLIGSPRPGNKLRTAVIEQCANATRCLHVDCSKDCPRGSCRRVSGFCGEPRLVAIQYLSSVFCLMPNGDTATRRSAFDAIISGCIPVFFEDNSFQKQYLWYHNGTMADDVSVLLNKTAVVSGELDILAELERIPEEEVLRLRSNGLELMPKIIYKDHGRSLPKGSEGFEDAFDVAIDGLLSYMKRPCKATQ